MKFVKRAFGEFNKSNMKWSQVLFFLSYDFLNVILLSFQWKLSFCNGRRHGVTCSHRKCYVTCGHNIIHDMTLSTE